MVLIPSGRLPPVVSADVPDKGGCAYGSFDFDELDALEAAKCSSNGQRPAQSECCPPQPCAEQALAKTATDSVASHGRPRKPISRARAWFEIRRWFEAEPQKYYDSPDCNEWKTYYAKELLLKAACDRLQRDGYVVIDAQLAPAYFQRLAGRLLLEAPDQSAALRDHVGVNDWHAALGGSHTRPALGDSPDSGALVLSSMQDGDGDMQECHDRALCESCLLSLAPDRKESSGLRPYDKEQFFRFFKVFLHEIAANSMNPNKAPDDQKIPVQLCFGNLPRPKEALTGPPPTFAITG